MLYKMPSAIFFDLNIKILTQLVVPYYIQKIHVY